MSSFDEKREALRQQRMMTGKNLLKSTLFLAAFCGFMALFMVPMGMTHAINTMMNTAYRILMDLSLSYDLWAKCRTCHNDRD